MTISLLVSGASALAGAIGGGANNKKAKKEEARQYNASRDYLNSEYYRDPLSSIGNRALLKSFDQRMKDSADAMNNRMIAGGATMENQLAARQNLNEATDRFYTGLLQSEDARRQALGAQRLQLDQQHSANVQNQYAQSAQTWQNWGAAMGDAAMQWGNATLLDQLERERLGLGKAGNGGNNG